MTDWRPHWAKLESGLVTLLEGLPSLPTEDRASVLHYIDHNEYGLAFEELCSCLKQERLHISSAQYEMIVNLQTMMKIQNVAESIRDLIER
jgi:hypothetical protein